MDLTLPLPGSKPDYDPATDHLEYLKMLQGSGTAGEAPAFWSVDVASTFGGGGPTSTMTFTFNEALRSGGPRIDSVSGFDTAFCEDMEAARASIAQGRRFRLTMRRIATNSGRF